MKVSLPGALPFCLALRGETMDITDRKAGRRIVAPGVKRVYAGVGRGLLPQEVWSD
jgi:hypothetical protein